MPKDRINLREGHKPGLINDNIPIESDTDLFPENLTAIVKGVTSEHIKVAKADSELLKNIAKGLIKRKLKIGLDFDGVISDCGKLKSYAAKLIYGVEIPPERFKKELVVDKGILTHEQYIELQRQMYENPEIGSKRLHLVSGALKYIPRLQEDGHELIVISSRGEGDKLKIARDWMISKSLDLDIIGVELGASKVKACKGLDIYIDDDLDKLEPLVDVVPYRFLFSWGYNTHIKVPQSVAKRIKSWKHFYKEVSNLNL